MSDKDLKDIIQNHFEHYSAEANPAWRNDMSEKLDAYNKKKKRRLIIIFFPLSMLLILGVTVGIYYLSNSTGSNDRVEEMANLTNENKLHTSESNERDVSKKHTHESETPSQVATKANENSSAASINGDETKQNENKIHHSLASEKVNVLSDDTENRASIHPEGRPLSAANVGTSQNGLDSVETKDEIINSSIASVGVQKDDALNGAGSNEHPTRSSDDSGLFEEIAGESEHKSDSSDKLNNETTHGEALNNATPNEEIAIRSENESDSLNQLSDENTNSQSSDNLVNESLTEKQDEDEKPVDEALSLWEIGLLGGVSYDHRTFTALTPSSYYDEREKGENTSLGRNISFEIARKFGKYQIVSGLSYNELRETIAYDPVSYQTDEVIETYDDNSYWEYDSIMQQGVWYYFDSVYIQNIDTNYQTITTMIDDNSGQGANGITLFRYTRIPLRFGFPIHHFSKLKVDGFVGVSVGILTASKGNYLANNGGIISAQTRKVTLNSYLALRIRYPLGGKFSLGAEAYVRVDHGNHSPIIDVKRRYTSFGLNAGLFYSL